MIFLTIHRFVYGLFLVSFLLFPRVKVTICQIVRISRSVLYDIWTPLSNKILYITTYFSAKLFFLVILVLGKVKKISGPSAAARSD